MIHTAGSIRTLTTFSQDAIMKIENAKNKLTKFGYMTDSGASKNHQVWIDCTVKGRPDISFWVDTKLGTISSAFRIAGYRPDRPECDECYSTFCDNLTQALRMVGK
jgi:hypothetical protein